MGILVLYRRVGLPYMGIRVLYRRAGLPNMGIRVFVGEQDCLIWASMCCIGEQDCLIWASMCCRRVGLPYMGIRVFVGEQDDGAEPAAAERADGDAEYSLADALRRRAERSAGEARQRYGVPLARAVVGGGEEVPPGGGAGAGACLAQEDSARDGHCKPFASLNRFRLL